MSQRAESDQLTVILVPLKGLRNVLEGISHGVGRRQSASLETESAQEHIRLGDRLDCLAPNPDAASTLACTPTP